MRDRVPASFAIALLALLAGCAPAQKPAKAALTEHQRDSVLATEPIPGAATVGRALEQSAKASAGAAQMDSLAR